MGRSIAPPLSHDAAVSAICFNPTGSIVLTGSEDGLVRLWDRATTRPLGSPLEHGGSVLQAVFSPGGSTLAVAARGSTARIWRIPIPVSIEGRQVLRWAEAVSGMELDGNGQPRPLSAEQWRERRRGLDAAEATATE